MDLEKVAETDLRDYLRVLGRRKWTVVLAMTLVAGTALGASFLQTPIYQASASLLLEPRVGESLFNPNTGQVNDPNRAVETEIQMLRSQPVSAAVAKQLGAAPAVAVSQVGSTQVIQVKAESTVPAQAANIANAYASAYINFRRTQAVDDLIAAGEQVQNRVTDLQRQLDRIDGQMAAAFASQSKANLDVLTSERSAIVSQQTVLKEKVDQLQVDAGLKTGGAQVVAPASPPRAPVRPTPKRNVVVGLALGMVLGVSVAFVFEYLDDSITTKEDLEKATHGLPVLATIPKAPGWRSKQEPYLISHVKPDSPSAEAYRSLRTTVQFLGLERPMRTIQVTSPTASEGKTTTLANLAVALARAGQRVVVVCCDLRRPRIHEFFGLSNEHGFTSVLLGVLPLSAALQAVPGIDRIALLASGPLPPNPSELLASKKTVELLTALQVADIVLIDSPPVLPVTDAAVLSTRVDATLLVSSAGSTTRKEVSRAVEALRNIDAPLLGSILNGVDETDGYGYKYGYGSYSSYCADRSRERTIRQEVGKL